jgi:hypothetical protein
MKPIVPSTDTATRLRAASQALMGTKSGSKFCQLLEQAAIELESLSGPEGYAVAETADIMRSALAYIKHVGANHTMRGQPHPQQWLVDKMEAWFDESLCATPQHTKEDV